MRRALDLAKGIITTCSDNQIQNVLYAKKNPNKPGALKGRDKRNGENLLGAGLKSAFSILEVAVLAGSKVAAGCWSCLSAFSGYPAIDKRD